MANAELDRKSAGYAEVHGVGPGGYPNNAEEASRHGGGPLPFSGSLDLLVPVVEAWCKEHPAAHGIGWRVSHEPYTWGNFCARIDLWPCEDVEPLEEGETAAEALAKAFAKALEADRP